MARVQPAGRGEEVVRTGPQAQPSVAASTRLVDQMREQTSCPTSPARDGRPRPDRLRNRLSRPASRGRAARYPVALQLQVQAEGLVHLRHDLRRYPTQDRSDAFNGHRTHLLGLSL